MLKHNIELFLDDKKISEVSQILNTKIHILDNPDDIINTLIGISKSQEFLDYAEKINTYLFNTIFFIFLLQ